MQPIQQAADNATMGAADVATKSMELAQHVPGGAEFGWGGYFQALAAVFLILGALAFAFYILKRYGRRAGLSVFNRDDLEIEGQLAIGPKKNVVVVRFLNKRLVLGVTDSNINLLTEADINDEPEHKEFSQSLEQAQKSHDSS